MPKKEKSHIVKVSIRFSGGEFLNIKDQKTILERGEIFLENNKKRGIKEITEPFYSFAEIGSAVRSVLNKGNIKSLSTEIGVKK
jgi:hypothetical protein